MARRGEALTTYPVLASLAGCFAVRHHLVCEACVILHLSMTTVWALVDHWRPSTRQLTWSKGKRVKAQGLTGDLAEPLTEEPLASKVQARFAAFAHSVAVVVRAV